MYAVFDFYESYFGEMVFVSDIYEECIEFSKKYRKENYGECSLRILERP